MFWTLAKVAVGVAVGVILAKESERFAALYDRLKDELLRVYCSATPVRVEPVVNVGGRSVEQI